MSITALRIANFRNLAAVDIAPQPGGLNLICGNNGSGKTSLLEAIHYLGLGRSFRTATTARLIQHDQEKFSVFAQLVNHTERQIPIGVERDRQGAARLRVAEKDAINIIELASFLPVRIINTQSHHLFESGPVFRRKYLDWGLFYQADNFLTCWRQFERVLKQRNAALRDRKTKPELKVWTDELVKFGLELDQMRRQYIQALTPHVQTAAQALLGMSHLTLHYSSGWPEEQSLDQALTNVYLEEYRLGYTQFGPQRADLDFQLAGDSVKHFLSRGQQKLLVCAMILAQGSLLAKANKRLVYLIDDLPAELDLQSKNKLLSLLAQQQTQVFITAIERMALGDFGLDTDATLKMFHVEQGRVREG